MQLLFFNIARPVILSALVFFFQGFIGADIAGDGVCEVIDVWESDARDSRTPASESIHAEAGNENGHAEALPCADIDSGGGETLLIDDEIDAYFIVDKNEGGEFFSPISLSLSQTIGRNIGTIYPYTTLEAEFFMFTSAENVCPFIDIRGHRFTDNTYGGNNGFGFRYMLHRSKKILGVNFYHDYQKSRHNQFNQIGIGLEYLGSCVSLRCNGYLPVGKIQGKWGPAEVTHYPGGYVAINQVREGAFSGVDAELEWTFLRCCRCMRASIAAGPYCYFHEVPCEDNIWGGRMALRAYYGKYLYFSVEGTRDTNFGTLVQGRIGITIPFYTHFLDCCCCSNPTLLFQPVWRNETIVRDRHCSWTWNW